MRSNYKKLGNYIRRVDVRNKDGSITNLLGVNLSKRLMPSIAKTHGVDLTKYKVLSENQFACKFMSVGRDEKLPIGFYQLEEKAIVSSAYFVFETIDRDVLDPEYLMMWISREEHDRLLWFKSGGDVRGSISWDDFCEVEIPIPSIQKQREIVREYNVVNDLVMINEQLTLNLEDTARAIYKEWFVDFEFPITNEYAKSIGKLELEGQPYKSSGGEMFYCNDLGQHIPIIWESSTLEKYIELSQGIQVPPEEQFSEISDGLIRFIRIIDYTEGANEPPRFIKNKGSRYACNKKDVVIVRYGIGAGNVGRRIEGLIANNLFKVNPVHRFSENYMYYFLSSTSIQNIIKGSAGSSAMPAVTHGSIKNIYSVVPHIELIEKFDKLIDVLEANIVNRINRMNALLSLRATLLTRISKS